MLLGKHRRACAPDRRPPTLERGRAPGAGRTWHRNVGKLAPGQQSQLVHVLLAGVKGMHALYQQLDAAPLGTDTDQEMHALSRWAFVVQWAVALLEVAAKAPGAAAGALGGSDAGKAKAKGKGSAARKPAKAGGRRATHEYDEDEDDEDDDNDGGADGSSGRTKRGSAAPLQQTWPAQKEAILAALRNLLKLPLGRVFHVSTERDALITYVAASSSLAAATRVRTLAGRAP